MSEEAFQRVLNLYVPSGVVEEIQGDTQTSAEEWLEQAENELPGVAALIEMAQYRMAYRCAYDIIRNAAEAVVTKAGYRVTSKPGHHEASLAVAHSLVGDHSDAFSGYRSAQARGKRSKAQYIDVNANTEVDETEARAAYQWAAEAIEAASPFVR